MAATRQLAELLEHVEQADGKLVLVGDHRQLPEIEAGGAFRALVARGLAVELVHNQRQAEAVGTARARPRRRRPRRRGGRRLPAARPHPHRPHAPTRPAPGSSRTGGNAAKTGEDAIILAHRRTDVAELNQLARASAARRRAPPTARSSSCPAAASPPATWSSIKRNDHQHGVTNGDRGTITHVDPEHQRLTVRIDNRQIELGPGFLHDTTSQGGPTLQHGYALTCHVAQGLTADSAFLLADTASAASSPTPRSPAAAPPTTSTSPNIPSRRTPSTRRRTGPRPARAPHHHARHQQRPAARLRNRPDR